MGMEVIDVLLSLVFSGGEFMSLINTVGIIKRELYRDCVVFVKVGAFYNVYFKDAVIVSYLFGYKLKMLDGDVENCGFPEVSLKNVKFLLGEKRISYIVIDEARDYEGHNGERFFDENFYDKCYEEAFLVISNRRRIEAINKVLLEKADRPEIGGILDEIESCFLK